MKKRSGKKRLAEMDNPSLLRQMLILLRLENEQLSKPRLRGDVEEIFREEE